MNTNRLSYIPGSTFYGYPDPITPATYAAINRVLGQANVGWIRVDFDIGGVIAAGADTTTAQWAAMDSAVTYATCSGLNVLGVLQNTPPALVNRTVPYTSTAEKYKYLPDNMQNWAAWVRVVVNHYPQVRYWSIWNEPNGFGYFRGYGTETTPAQLVAAYDTLVKYAAPAIRGNYDAQGRRYLVAPEVGDGGGLTAAVPWVQQVLASQGPNIDVVAVHRYGFQGNGSDVNSYAQSMAQQVQGTPQQAGGSWSGPVWLTEAGLVGCNGYPQGSRPVYCVGTQYKYTDGNYLTAQLTSVFGGMGSANASGNAWAKTFPWHSHEEIFVGHDSTGVDSLVNNNRGLLAGARANALAGRPAFTAYAGITAPLGVSGAASYASNQNVAVTATPTVPDTYYYVWEYQWCWNGNAVGDCDHQCHAYASGTGLTTISPRVYAQDLYVYTRVRQYAWQSGPQIGSGAWDIAGDGTCTDPRGCPYGPSGGGGMYATPATPTDSVSKGRAGPAFDPTTERRKGIGHAGNK